MTKLHHIGISAVLAFLASGCMSTGTPVDSVTAATGNSTTSSGVTISPSSDTIAPNATLQFSASGGTPPYYYSVMSGGGTINYTSGLYTAPNIGATVQIAAQDSAGGFSYATITVQSSTLTLSSSATTIAEGGTIQFSTTGGTSPYTYSVVSGSGSVNASSGLYTAPTTTTGSTEIMVEDTVGDTAYEVIVVSTSSSGSTSNVLTFVTAASNYPLANLPAANVLEDSESTFFSSLPYPAMTSSTPPDLAVWFATAQSISQVNLLARMYQGAPLGFPVAYEIYVTDPYNSYWIDLGNYSNQPDTNGNVSVTLPSTYTTYGVLITATQMGVDNTDTYYFQLCGVTAQ